MHAVFKPFILSNQKKLYSFNFLLEETRNNVRFEQIKVLNFWKNYCLLVISVTEGFRKLRKNRIVLGAF